MINGANVSCTDPLRSYNLLSVGGGGARVRSARNKDKRFALKLGPPYTFSRRYLLRILDKSRRKKVYTAFRNNYTLVEENLYYSGTSYAYLCTSLMERRYYTFSITHFFVTSVALLSE